MKKGLRGLACLLALAVLLLALPTGASAETWTADWTGSTMFTLTGTISNGSIILVAELYRNLGKIYINGVHGDSGPLGDLVIPTIISGANYNITLAARAFSGNKTLTSITASSAVSSIQDSAFQNCANLVYAYLSACTNMTNVNQELFEGCTSLETVILPSSIKEIYGEAFRDCSNLNTIYILSKDPPTFFQRNYFYGCPDDMKIVIVNGDVATYKAAPGWNFYADQIVGGSLLTASPASKAWTVQRGEQPQPTTFTLKNENGNNAVVRDNLSVTLTGDTNAFTLGTDDMADSLSAGASTNFTVTPKTDLPTGTYTAHVQVKSGDVIYASIPLTLTVEGAPLTGAQVEVENSDSIYYTGQEQQPNVTVTLNDTPLTENRDYTLSYSNNTNAGEATVTVTGKGDYSKTATGTFTIQPATLTITDAELSPKTYDGTTAATVTSVDFDGLVNGEKLDSGTGYTATAVFDDANAGEGKTATVTVELKNTNYTFKDGTKETTYPLTNQTIAPCPVTVTPNAKSKAYGQSDPALTYTVSGLASGDSLTGALSRAAGENAGSYLIGQATLTDANNPNYAITFDGTKALTIKKADVTLTVTVDPASQKAGKPVTVTVTAQNAEENLMATGWDQPDGVTVTMGGEPVTMTFSEGAWTGTWTIPAGTGDGNVEVSAQIAETDNYNAATNSATLAVTEKGAVTVALTPSASSVTYGDSVTLTATVAKADPGDQDALTGTVQFYLDRIDEAGKVGEAQAVTGPLSVTLDRDRLTAGDHTVYAVYEGNNAFATAQAQADIKVASLTLGWDASELTASRSQAQSGEAAVYGTLRLTGTLEGDSVTLTPNTGLVTVGLSGVTQPGQYPVRVVPASGPYSLDNQNYALPADAPTITAVVHASTEEDVPTTGGALLKLIVEEGLSDVPTALTGTYANPAALEAALRADLTARGVPEANVAVYDATLWVSKDGGQSWTEAAESDFPASGLTVTVPYPAGTGAQGYTFAVAHMFVSGTHAGDIEHPTASAAEKGVAFTVTGLSPVAVGWTADSYTVTLHPNGGTIAAGKDVTAYTYGVGATLPTAADVTRDLYTFAGWYDNEALTGDPVAAITPTDAGNKEYWAKWNLIPGDPPAFTEPDGPKEVTVQPGEQATLTASATGATVCQWYVNRGDGAGYVAISGATAMTYTTSPVTLDNDGYTYYCEATNLYGTARSAVFTLRVREPAVPPQTGDHSHTGLWVALMLLSLGGLGALGLGRRRQSGKR